MRKIRAIVLGIVFIGTLTPSAAQEQEEQKPSLDAGTIDSQFEYVIDESNNYQQYEVIQGTWMVKLRAHVNDTLKVLHQTIQGMQAELDDRAEEILKLQGQLTSTQDTLAETRAAQNEMAFVGMPMEKSSYRVTMWSIIGVLLILLVVFIFRFNNSNVVTKEAKEALATVQDEFDQHRKRSLEREQKLRRELQDELNKQNKT